MQDKNEKLPYITPLHVGGMPECFMSHRICPVCGCINHESFMMDNADYYCESCCRTMTYKVPKQPKRRARPTIKPNNKLYSYLITRNGL